ncbi:WD40/YVTN/BNR-like repeat-containing protein [Nocardia pseudovaccinii]|uniref:WD40/YVTN/BNR-like repeat-containing protein n=1 Tax=Nocardia pseudovaccinii TaxID=189540 RepID=UPI003D8F1412
MIGTVLVATAGQGILRTSNDGKKWSRLSIGQDLKFDSVVRSLLVHPVDPNVVFAGTELGLCRSDDAGATWSRIDSPMNDMHIWTLSVDPNEPQTLLAGTGAPSRAAVFRSIDGGRQWERLSPEIPEFCAGVDRPRILTSVWDHVDGKSVYFGIEEGGLWRSRDRGDTWQRIDGDPDLLPDGVTHSDVHSIVVLSGPPKTIVVAVVNAFFVSHDDGATWQRTDTRDTWGIYYTRLFTTIPETDDLLLGIGDGTPGTETKILKSTDLGHTWTPTSLDTPANSTTWAFATHTADPDLIFAGTKYGHLFRSTDSGDNWVKEWREFPEITDVAWTPARAKDNASH